ncbi:MAG: arylesterase, partial [Pseudomonadota bacterium]|nr:arylesterase [Pseudomonadota bacterium]
MRILVYGDSNSWGYLDDGSGLRFADRWPVSMARRLTAAGQDVELIEECLPGRTTNVDDPQEGAWCNGLTPLEAILL